jgi:hypothetical protein
MPPFKTKAEIKAERDAILGKMNWTWKRKNILGMPYSKSLKDDFPKLRAGLHDLGYTIDKRFTSLSNNHVAFTFGDVEDSGRWYVEISVKEYLDDITAFFEWNALTSPSGYSFFEWIDENFEIGENYLGSKEWKRDMCKKYDIPMTGALSFLDPPNGFWIHNEFKESKK